MIRHLLVVLLAFQAATAHADCGDENLIVPLNQIHESVRRSAVGVVTFAGPIGDNPEALEGFADAKLASKKAVKLEDSKPVSMAPACGQRKPFEGSRFPLLEITPEAIKVVYSAPTGEAIWLKRGDLEKAHKLSITDFSAFKKYAGLNVRVLHGDPLLFKKPSVSSGRVAWPQGANVLKVLRQYQDFVELGLGGWEGKPIGSIGWMTMHDEDGFLQVWPWFYDDC